MKAMKRFYSLHYLIIIIFALQISILSGKNMISLFIRPFPTKQETPTLENLIRKIQLLGRTSYKILKEALSRRTYDGILATYYGYITLSDFNGQIVFPRKHQKDTILLLITPIIEPIMMIGTIVHHWETLPGLPAQCFSLERKQDETTQAYYWDTQETEIQKSNHIPLETIVLFAHPNNIFVPTGITLTTKSPHLILPTIYAQKDLKIAANALRVLKIKHFFSSVDSAIKKQNDVYYTRQW